MTEPSPTDTVELARTAIRDVLQADRGLTVSELADEIGVNDLTLSRFIAKDSTVVPRKHVWQLIKRWVHTRAPTSDVVYADGQVRSVVSGGVAAYYAGVATGMAQAVRRAMLSAIQEQDRLIEHLQGLPDLFDRGAETAPGAQERAPNRDALEQLTGISQRELADDDQAIRELEERVGQGKAALAKPKKKRRAAG